jgi:hypothetical protein
MSLAWLEATIYCTQGEQANHHITDALIAVKVILEVCTHWSQ